MPRLNLKDESFDADSDGSERTVAPPPTLRDVGGGGGSSPLLLIVLIIVVLGAGVFALNYFGIISLWGKKTPQVTESLPPPDFGEPDVGASGSELDQGFGQQDLGTPGAGQPDAGLSAAPEPSLPAPSVTPDVTPPTTSPPARSTAPSRPAPVVSTSGTGNFTVQVSSWMGRGKADEEAARLTAAGYTAFVEDASVGGGTWYRVRVGRYATEAEAQQAAAQLQPMMEGKLWVARAGR